MASMEDLVATLGSGMHVGQQANDLKELQAKLAQTIHPTKAPYRPIPPPSSFTSPSGPFVPPAPASSWNDSYASTSQHPTTSNSPPHQSDEAIRKTSPKRDVGFSIPPPKNQQTSQSGQNGQTSGLSHVSNSPVDEAKFGGFRDDAFRPMWDQQQNNQDGIKADERR